MAALHTVITEPHIAHHSELVAHLAAGCKPPSLWRIGTEHEKFGFDRKTLRPISYDGDNGIRAVLHQMVIRYGWEPVLEGETPIALRRQHASVSLEPGGQVELSGAPLATIHETDAEIKQHLCQLATICREMGIAFLGIGAQPKWRYEDIPWMPKGRYKVMRAYMPTRGRLGLDMMTRTATVQANLDFSDEADMVAKFRLSLALQPMVTALFANSPFTNGQPNGYRSYRMAIWQETDPDRCGALPFVFEPGFGFERYADYALDVPMYFLYRHGRYLETGGGSFRTFMQGKLPNAPGERPTMKDWELHLTTLFPDVRLKQYLEMRGADAGNSKTLTALPALWKGLLYDRQALAEAWELVSDWSLEEREKMHQQAPRLAMQTEVPGFATMQGLALRILAIAEAGLRRLACRNGAGDDESIYLKPLWKSAKSGRSPAERLLEAFHGRWNGMVEPVFQEKAFESFFADCV